MEMRQSGASFLDSGFAGSAYVSEKLAKKYNCENFEKRLKMFKFAKIISPRSPIWG